MKKHNQEYLKTQYAELLDEGSDPALAQLIGDLDSLYRAAPEPPRHLTTLRAETMLRELEYGQVNQRRSWRREWRRSWTGPRFVLAGMAATILLVVGVIIGLTLSQNERISPKPIAVKPMPIAPTIGPLKPTPTAISNVLPPNVSLPAIDPVYTDQPEARLCTGTLYCVFDSVAKLGLTQVVNQSKHVDGLNITVNRVYADATQVYVWYSVGGLTPMGGTVFVGDSLQLSGLNGPLSHNQHWTNTLAGQQISANVEAVSVFELPRSNSNPKELNLRLNISRYSIYPVRPGLPSDANTAVVTLNDPSVTPVGFPTPTALSLPGTRTNIFSEPLAFDFKVTLQESRIIEVNKDMTSNNVQLFLSHAVIMPEETRLFLRKTIFKPNNIKYIKDDKNVPIAQLSINDAVINEPSGSMVSLFDPQQDTQPAASNQQDLTVMYTLVKKTRLLEQTGKWAVKIYMYNRDTKVAGTDFWTFQFNYS